jgi:hypothetical protein
MLEENKEETLLLKVLEVASISDFLNWVPCVPLYSCLVCGARFEVVGFGSDLLRYKTIQGE